MNFFAAVLLTVLPVQEPASHVIIREQGYETIASGPRTRGFLGDGRALVSYPPRGEVLDLRGGRIVQIGREGEGPGEFQNPLYLGLIGDTVWVADSQLRRVTTIGPGADRPTVRTYSTVTETEVAFPFAYLGGGALLAARDVPTDGATLVLRLLDGKATTLATGRIAREVTVMFGSTVGDGAMKMLHPFRDDELRGFDVVNNRLVWLERSREDRYTIRWLDVLSGSVVREREYRVEPTRTRDTVERLADWWWSRQGASLSRTVTEARFKDRFVQAIGEPRYLPPVARMVVAASGHIWVEGPPVPQSSTSRWTMLTSDGERIGDVDVPPGRQLLAAYGDRVLVLEDDAIVAIYRVMRRPTES